MKAGTPHMPLLKELTLAATTWFSTTDDLVINNPVYQVFILSTQHILHKFKVRSQESKTLLTSLFTNF